MRTKYVAARVLPDAENLIMSGAVVVEGDRIAWVGPAAEAPEAETVVDLPEAVLMPGLVNAHSHLDLTHLRGAVPYHGEFAPWLAGIAEGRERPGMRGAAVWGVKEALSRGTTAFGDIVAPGNFAEMVGVFAETGARGRPFGETIGFRPEVADRAFERVWELAEMKALPETVATGLSPHSAYAVSRPLLDRAVAMADGHGTPLAVHFAETLEELAFLRHGIGPLRDLLKRFDADDPEHAPYRGPQAFLALLQLSHAPLLLVHCNYLRPRDVPAGAFVVYCPTAHGFFGHPEHPVLELLEEGVRVVLGSDSAASGETVDALSETQHLARARTDLSPRAVFRMVTDWAARALGLAAGTLAPGKLADLAAFTPALDQEILGHQEARCVLTAVGGRILWRAEPDADGTV
ncbi:MAG: amidohydrolase family protein [Planctomycetota bacterium]